MRRLFPQTPTDRLLATGVGGVLLLEWALLEVLRTPYRPPHDMTTLLGVEKYGLIGVMLALSVSGAGLAACWFGRTVRSGRDAAVAATLLGVATFAAVLLVAAPPWPVTPALLLFR